MCCELGPAVGECWVFDALDEGRSRFLFLHPRGSPLFSAGERRAPPSHSSFLLLISLPLCCAHACIYSHLSSLCFSAVSPRGWCVAYLADAKLTPRLSSPLATPCPGDLMPRGQKVSSSSSSSSSPSKRKATKGGKERRWRRGYIAAKSHNEAGNVAKRLRKERKPQFGVGVEIEKLVARSNQGAGYGNGL